MRALKVSTFIVALALAYAALLCHPESLFAYHVRAGAIALHSPKPLPPQAQHIAQAVNTRVARSPLYDPNAAYHVYLCETPQRFAFFSTYRWRVGGVVYGWLSPNAFLRPAHIEHDRLLSPSGRELAGERTLTYFIAHEVVHSMLSIHLGARRYLELSTWQNEGYADYIAKAGAFDYAAELQRYHAGAPDLDPAKSGLYLRYHLTVSYWLDRRGLSVDQLLKLPKAAARFEGTPTPGGHDCVQVGAQSCCIHSGRTARGIRDHRSWHKAPRRAGTGRSSATGTPLRVTMSTCPACTSRRTALESFHGNSLTAAPRCYCHWGAASCLI